MGVSIWEGGKAAGLISAVNEGAGSLGDAIAALTAQTTALNAKLEAHNHLISHQNASIDLIAADKRAAAIADVSEVARLCGAGEILEVMDYGDQIAPAWSEGETNYNPALNLCHEGDALLEDGESIHGAFFEWDKTTPTAEPFDAPEAIYYCDGTTEAVGAAHILIGKDYGAGWKAEDGIQIEFAVQPQDGDQLVISLGASLDTDPTAGRTWTLYEAGTTTVRDTGTTAKGTSGTLLGSTDSTDAGKTNGRVNAPQRAVYGYGRWSQSSLRQRLNSVAAVGAWWKKQNPWDRPPAAAATLAGFLSGYSADVYKYFKPIKVQTITCNADGNVVDITYDRVFLSSLEQMYAVPQFPGQEGEYWEYYKRLLGRTTPAPTSQTYKRLIKYALNSATAQNCFRRSAYRHIASHVWYVYSNGNLNTSDACYGLRCAPSVFLSD